MINKQWNTLIYLALYVLNVLGKSPTGRGTIATVPMISPRKALNSAQDERMMRPFIEIRTCWLVIQGLHSSSSGWGPYRVGFKV